MSVGRPRDLFSRMKVWMPRNPRGKASRDAGEVANVDRKEPATSSLAARLWRPSKTSKTVPFTPVVTVNGEAVAATASRSISHRVSHSAPPLSPLAASRAGSVPVRSAVYSPAASKRNSSRTTYGSAPMSPLSSASRPLSATRSASRPSFGNGTRSSSRPWFGTPGSPQHVQFSPGGISVQKLLDDVAMQVEAEFQEERAMARAAQQAERSTV